MFGPSSMSPVYVLDAPGQNRPSPPRFSAGEKVAKPDEGAFHEDVIRAPSSALGPASVSLISRKAPPSSAFGTFSPRKKPRGEKGSRRREWQGSRGNKFT